MADHYPTSLFDLVDSTPSSATPNRPPSHGPVLGPPDAESTKSWREVPREWREVPQALFLSWSHERQASYCAARDEDSARDALTPEWAEWYRGRAGYYRSLI
jgi:hypothetical protein